MSTNEPEEPTQATGDPPSPAPAHGPSRRALRTMAIVRWLLLGLVTSLAGVSVWTYWGPGASDPAAVAQDHYYCSMHPQIRSPEPGECPICHMDLVPIPEDRQSTPRPGTSDRTPLGPGDVTAVTVSGEQQRTIGLTTTPVESTAIGDRLRVPGVLSAPETGRSEVRVRAPGFVEQVSVRQTGGRVSAGQPLAFVYSPDIYRAQEEFIAAERWSGAPEAAGSADSGSTSIAASARRALELLGMSSAEIDQVARTKQPIRAVAVRAPAAGVVTRNNAVLGSRAGPEMLLYEIADLSSLWVIASVQERDLPALRVGTEARFAISGRADEPLLGKVDLIEPLLEEATRSVRVRLVLNNRDGRLRPGQFGDVEFDLPAAPGLFVPRDAVIRTGQHEYVYVATADERFEPRSVTTGLARDGRVQVLTGVSVGDRVVTRGSFLLDSESRLQASLAAAPAPEPEPERDIALARASPMIGWLIDTSAKYRALVLFGAVALAIAGVTAMRNVKLDAVPDLSDPQVVVFTEWMGRSPTLVEDQVTYPLVTALLGAPHVVDVRGQTMFGMSFVYVVFEEGTDIYWARSRVLEYLSTVRNRLPADVSPRLGPDATGIGWVYQYALVDKSGQLDLGQLRTLQDFSLRYALTSVPGVAEVASVGGYEQQYQVTVDPLRLRNFGLGVADVVRAVRRSNSDVGARVLEMSEREYFVRGRGYLTKVEDLENIVVRAERGTPVLVRDVGHVTMGGDIRRGAADFDGQGETVSGIVVMRYGENALEVINRVERKLDELRPTLPAGVEVVPVYNRRDLIERAIDTLKSALSEEMFVVAVVIILFLLHLRSALLPIISLPLAVTTAFIPMYFFGIPATILSLGGIAIAIGATVDAEIVMVEAAHKKLENAPPDLSPVERERLLAEAAREVTPAIFFSLLIIAASFLPVFGLTGQAGRLFKPLAYTKTFVMLSAALLSVTVAPALRDYLIRGKIFSEARHPVSRAIRRVYEPFVHVALHNPRSTVLIGVMALVSALPIAQRLGSEFMPPLDEGDLLYMPTTFPNISIEAARQQLQRQDQALKSFPEVLSVLGKIGRAETATDPAPLSMVETVVRLKPRSEWRRRHTSRWYSDLAPGFARPLLNWLQPEQAPMTREDLVQEMTARLQQPGFTNAFTQPIRNRVDMLTTGIRTPIGIKVYGANLEEIERIGTSLERVMHEVPGTRSVLFERSVGGLYVDVVPNRQALARYGLQVEDVNEIIESALGGLPITTTIEGRNRFTVNVRYAQDFRTSIESVRDVSIPLPSAAVATSEPTLGSSAVNSGPGQIPLSAIADVRVVSGPPMIRDEAGLLVGYVYVDIEGHRDVGSYVDAAKATVEKARQSGALTTPAGYYFKWTGQYELLAEMENRMKVLIPIALLVTILLLYLQFKNFTEVLIVLLSVPFALVGSVWALWLLDYNLSTAVWVGVIALVGLAAQTGVVMIVYIDHAYQRRLSAGGIHSLEDIIAAHAEGTIQRVRPKLMTVSTMLIGLVPLLWAEGSGADVMKRIAAPMVGGLVTSAFLTLEIIPVIYTYWRSEQLLWRRLTEARVSLLRPMRQGVNLLKLAGGVVLFACALRLYATSPPAWLLPAIWSATSTMGLLLVAYLVLRKRAERTLARAPLSQPLESAS